MNPFRDTIVASPWEAARSDVPAIHGKVFDRCLAGIGDVRQSHRSEALLIHGEAGSGKTHLLSRLRERLAPREPSATNRNECLFVWVRLQTSPRMIWRTLRRTLVDDWFRPVAGGHTQFERILFHRLAEIRPAEGDLERWYEYMLDQHPDGLLNAMEQIATNLDLDRNTDIAFKHIAFSRHLRDLRAWLAGTSLPEAALERLDLEQSEGTDEDREDESRQIVLMFCRLAGNGLPIVLSFDQVEALQFAPGDSEALFAFAQLISALRDGTSNVLLISCVQSAFYSELKSKARDADYDRITSYGAVSLDPLSRNEAEQLIASRLTGAAELTSESPRGPSWPLAVDEFEHLLAKGFVSPRKLLARCAERYETRTDRTLSLPLELDAKPQGIPEFLTETWEACLEQKLTDKSPAKTDEIVRQGLPLLVRLVAPQSTRVRIDRFEDVDPVFESPTGRYGFSLCTQANMTSLAAQLKRLRKHFPSPGLKRLVLVRDSRVPIPKTAKVARQQLTDLEQQGARVVYPSVEVLAALDALRELLSDAKSGDLACRGEPISPQTVEEWLLAHLPGDLRDFVDNVMGTAAREQSAPPSDTRDIEALTELLAKSPLMTLHDAALALERPLEELTAIVARHPDQFHLLGQPPSIVFRGVGTVETPA
ncbi:MAG: ATP-binding protein [Planctomycetaceae bacterium]|nr:ATP-binding protein [Planctomycetaceae bacterium]